MHAEIKPQPSDIRHDQKVQTGPRRMDCLKVKADSMTFTAVSLLIKWIAVGFSVLHI